MSSSSSFSFPALFIDSVLTPLGISSSSAEGAKPYLFHGLALYGLYQCVTQSFVCRRLLSEVKRLLFATSSTSWLEANVVLPLIEMGAVPDAVIRWGIRGKLAAHLVELSQDNAVRALSRKMDILDELSSLPVAIETKAANDQHYEVPAAFYDLTLGPHKKYSSGLWLNANTTMPESEQAMLELYAQRAQLTNGMRVVDLGCGWGSLTLYVAAKYPSCQVIGISNSHSQRDYILKVAEQRGLKNVSVLTCNLADDAVKLDKDLASVKNVDRVLSIEMFEHMKNYSSLMKRIHGFLKPDGKVFLHIFTHKSYAYHFDGGWMSENFFTGGTMISDDLILYLNHDFTCTRHWRVSGSHYSKTSNEWLRLLDTAWKSQQLQPVLTEAYGAGQERKWYTSWRLFFLACAELWGYQDGNEWVVSHYLLEKR